MTLAEAFKASKVRQASGCIVNESGEILFIGIASDGVVTIIDRDRKDYLDKSWADLLPSELALIDSVDWQPLFPKDPLQQLAETLTDWNNDD